MEKSKQSQTGEKFANYLNTKDAYDGHLSSIYSTESTSGTEYSNKNRSNEHFTNHKI